MINYTIDPNQLDVNKTACIIALFLVPDDSDPSPAAQCIAEGIGSIHSILYKDIKTGKDRAKSIKASLQADVQRIIRDEEPRSPIMKKVSILPYNYQIITNIAMEIARWPEWYIHTEQYQHEIAQELQNHKDEINAITFYDADGRICPYVPGTYHNDLDWRTTFYAQSEHVEEFAKCHDVDPDLFSVNDLINVMEGIMADFCSDEYIPDNFERGMYNSIQYMRKHAAETENEVWNYISGNAKPYQFSLSESQSPLAKYEAIQSTINSIGVPLRKCSQVINNMFHGEFPTTNIQPQPGQVEIPYNMEYFDAAPGLGPAYKIRYVFNCDANIQNSLSPIADLIQTADRLYDPMEAYNDQMGLLHSTMHLIKDAFCIDATGYSDYLTRCIYTYLMQIYGLSDKTINFVQSVFRMPIKVGDELIPVEFGSMQGCKLLVFIMNQANRMVGIIAHRLRNEYSERTNAGDDVASLQFNRKFTVEEISREMLVFYYFNCPTNYSKVAWLARDGYFDFCSKYFARIKGSDSGVYGCTAVPPKIAGKQILCFATIAEWGKVADVSKIPHRSMIGFWHGIKPIVEMDMRDACRLLRDIDGGHADFDEKERYAAKTPYQLGGLAEWKDTSTQRKLDIIKFKFAKMINRYSFDASGIFLYLNSIGEEIKSTALYTALGTVHRQTASEIFKMIDILNSSADELIEEDIDWALDHINVYERNITKGDSISRNSSTYHRKELSRDLDIILPDEIHIDSIVPPITNHFDIGMILGSITDKDHVDIDNLKTYIRTQYLYKKYKDRIIAYTAYLNLVVHAIRDDDGSYGRIEYEDRYHKSDCINFKTAGSVWYNEEIKELRDLLRRSKVFTIANGISDLLSTSAEIQLRTVLQQHIEGITRSELRQLSKAILNY